MLKVYGSEICGDCRYFKALMAERGFDVEYIDMTENVRNLREFLALRDHSEAFAGVRERGSIGIPAFVNDDGQVTVDLNTALAWIGQPPVEEEEEGCATCK